MIVCANGHRLSLRRGLLLILCLLAFVVPAGADKPTVAIVRGDDPDKMLAEALELLGGAERFVKDGQTVVIKPNLTWQPAFDRWRRGRKDVKPRAGTDTRLTRGRILDILRIQSLWLYKFLETRIQCKTRLLVPFCFDFLDGL